jgi:hypothetical protein
MTGSGSRYVVSPRIAAMRNMQKYTIVSAIYNIYSDKTYYNLIWERFVILAKYFPVVLFCSAADIERAKAIEGVAPIPVEFADTDTYKIMAPVEGLPSCRNAAKDTREYLILMNAKAEFLWRASNIVTAEYYVWLDAGVSKIVSSPDVFVPFGESLDRYSSDEIRVPGVWGILQSGNLHKYVHNVYWRFCGGQMIVPRNKISPFYAESTAAIRQLIAATNTLTWEVNVWAFMEAAGFPFAWVAGDHNDSMFTPF